VDKNSCFLGECCVSAIYALATCTIFVVGEDVLLDESNVNPEVDL
jgi:hypothetical protein